MKRSDMGSKQKIRCSACRKGWLKPKAVTRDVGPLFDMIRVEVRGMPALVCGKCGEVSMIGSVLDEIGMMIAVEILQLTEIAPIEARYLRRLMGDTQDELAARLGVARATINRWENAPAPISGPEAYALRSHAYFRLRERSPVIDAVAASFTADRRPPNRTKKRKGFTLDGAHIQHAG
ncbi:MAG: helix-turn-helix domain-containing protein [Kofleriaceae bacterium]|nr:helix-turn-helix domain-containing protein [Kofleriaceae bacterium]